jgi:uncharacterized protein YndB with AHSA1/START domain
MERSIRHEFSFEQSPEEVWRYLIDPELLSLWLMPNDFKPAVGHRFQFKTRPKQNLKFNGVIYCEVLEVVPFKRLVYSWKGGMLNESPSLDSIVIWTLIPLTTGGTTLVLEHNGFKGLKNALAWFIMNHGWKKIGRRMVARINQKTA